MVGYLADSRKLSVIVLGFIHTSLGHDATRGYSESALDPAPTVASYAHALYAGLWSFDGFNQANYVAGEMRHPTRDIPRAIHLSMGLVAVPRSPFRRGCLSSCSSGFLLPRKRVIFIRPR
jgi:Amino acid permease